MEFQFEPYEYRPQYAGGSAPVQSTGASSDTGASTASRSGSSITVNRDIRLAYDLVTVSKEISGGIQVALQETFLCFPGDGTPQKMLMLLNYPFEFGKAFLTSSNPLTGKYVFPNGAAFNVRVVQRDLSTGKDSVIYPNTRYTEVSGKVDIVEPAASVKAQQPLYLVVASTLPFITGGVPHPGWNGDGDAPLTPVEYSPLRLQLTMPLLTSQVA